MLLLFFCTDYTLLVQVEVGKDEIIAALKVVRSKLNAIPSPTAAEKEKISDIRTQINYAILHIDKDPEKFPDAYLKSLENLADFIVSAVQKNTDKNQFLDIVAKDLHSKFSISPDNISSVSYTKLVNVRVMTQKGDQPVKNLRVHYNGLGYAINFAVPNNSFQDVTGPVQEDLVPGYYVFWATKDGDTNVLGKVTTEINATKENKVTIIIQ